MISNAEDRLLRSWRQGLHARAEVSGRESGTAGYVAEILADLGCDQLVTELGGHGLAAVFAGATDGPTLLFRAELDALPIPETVDLPWASRQAGCAHKCGHDGHMAILLGLARRLASRRPATGRVITLFQPAEETGTGARAVTDAPAFTALRPDWVFALHNLPDYPLGHVLVRRGAFAAASSGLRVELVGRTSHAAYPEQGLNPDQALAELVTALAVLPIPLEQAGRLALITVVHARLGEPAFGVTPGRAEVLATLRADRDDVMTELKTRATVAAQEIARRHGLDCHLAWCEEFPVTWNDERAVDVVREACRNLGFPLDTPQESPFRWSEDFGWFTALAPGAMFALGAGPDQPALHAETYDFNDALLQPGLEIFTGIVNRLT